MKSDCFLDSGKAPLDLARAVGMARMASGYPADRNRAPATIDTVRAEFLESRFL
jgi:hypothetical protein